MWDQIAALVLLTVLEVVLGIDNIVFITLLASRLPAHQRLLGERLGIGMAVLSRLLLLTLIQWIQSLHQTVAFTVFGHPLTYRSLVLLGGGLFLLAKATHEIHARLEEAERRLDGRPMPAQAHFAPMLAQIFFMDVVFSLDSVITAVGLARSYWVMVTSILVAAVLMTLAVQAISTFLARHPSMKMLALAFLVLIGALLVIEGWNPVKAEELHLKNYAYFAMAFSFFVELLNLRLYRHTTAVSPSQAKEPAQESELREP